MLLQDQVLKGSNNSNLAFTYKDCFKKAKDSILKYLFFIGENFMNNL